jgi:hypothetical protein
MDFRHLDNVILQFFKLTFKKVARLTPKYHMYCIP